MARKFVSLILLYNLLLLTCDHGNGIRKTKDPLENDDLLMKHSTGDALDDDDHQLTAHDNRHMDHMEDPKLGFVTINDLHAGKTISIYVPTRDPSSLPHFMPREEADSIPFSVKEFPYLLQLFKISQDSPQAKAIKNTLEDCESNPILEVKFCATSLESMVDSVRAIFGSQAPFKALSTTGFTKSDTLLQNYTFLEVKEVSTSMTVACHDLTYPYAVFYCHDLGETKVFEILVGGERGERATAFFICHMDTSSFTPDHIAFRVLGIKPGTSPVCHYIFPRSLLWVRS